MKKNIFLLYNELVYDLYSSNKLEDCKTNFLVKLKLLIPFSYASIILADDFERMSLNPSHPPICYPDYFEEVEQTYLKYADEDHLLWLFHCQEPTLIKESDVMDDETRLHSSLYQHCYQKYNIYDSLQYSIVYQQKLYGLLTLFRVKADGDFTNEDLFYLRALGPHLNAVLYRLCTPSPSSSDQDLSSQLVALQQEYKLTNREAQLLNLIFLYRTNAEIADEMQIQENTIQKHMQNIFRKMNVSSKWELLRLKPSTF
ncbi:MAG: LuxR C-terminal-related transcriptional regulator [Lachnospiraceae bacterium]